MQHFFTYLNRRISYHTHGEGPVVVLLHGFGEDAGIWDRQIAFLQPYCRLLIPDLPGSGASETLHTGPEASIEEYADCVYALLKHELVSTCILLGHSMGGYITLTLAEKHPTLVGAFGLVHSTAYADSAEKKINRQRGIEMMEQYGGPAFLKITIPNLFAAPFKKNHAEAIDGLIQQAASFSTLALQQYYYAMMKRPDRTVVLSGSKAPVLFIIGTEDVAAPLNDVLNQTSLPDCSYIHILKNVGHMGMWEATDAVNQHLLHFIRAAI